MGAGQRRRAPRQHEAGEAVVSHLGGKEAGGRVDGQAGGRATHARSVKRGGVTFMIS